jgi:ubiquinone/menaquinone biosynthesis C-methylase UbiE
MVSTDVSQIIPQTYRILDLGGGTGKIYDVLTKQGFDVTSVDIASNHPKVQIYDGHHLPFPDGTFDACICIYVLHHVPHALDLLREVRRVCREGSIMLLYEDLPPSHFIGYLQMAFHFLWFKQNPNMIRKGIRSTTEWKDCLRDSGWTITDTFVYPGQWHYLNKHVRFTTKPRKHKCLYNLW